MNYNTVIKIFGNNTTGETQGIVQRHKAGVRFFSGKREDADPAHKENYPLFYLDVTLRQSIKPSEFISYYDISCALVDILPTDRSSTEIDKVLDRMNRIMNDILIFFFLRYGYGNNSGVGVTYDNVTENCNFILVGEITYTKLVDDTETNLTGWIANFTIQEQTKKEDIVCALDNIIY